MGLRQEGGRPPDPARQAFRDTYTHARELGVSHAVAVDLATTDMSDAAQQQGDPPLRGTPDRRGR